MLRPAEGLQDVSARQQEEALVAFSRWANDGLMSPLWGRVKLGLQRVVVRRQADVLEAYMYLSLSSPLLIPAEQYLSLKNSLHAGYLSYFLEDADSRANQKSVFDTSATLHLSRLSLVSELPGKSAHLVPQLHYVVETDVENGWWDEITQWYEVEHLPGLASVPGCVLARRFLNLDEGPKSLACYDLEGEAVLTSPEWLAIRATPWSSKARPHFINTKRNLYPSILV